MLYSFPANKKDFRLLHILHMHLVRGMAEPLHAEQTGGHIQHEKLQALLL